MEELQRSVIFFSRANGTLKQQNEELAKLIIQAQATVTMIESGKMGSTDAAQNKDQEKSPSVEGNAASQEPVATNAPVGAPTTVLPSMPVGATMQQMANFQQACAQAMQNAMQGMQNIPGLNMSQLAASPAGASNFTDTMTALAMQQAASQLVAPGNMSFLTNPAMLAFQNSMAAAAAAQSGGASTKESN